MNDMIRATVIDVTKFPSVSPYTQFTLDPCEKEDIHVSKPLHAYLNETSMNIAFSVIGLPKVDLRSLVGQIVKYDVENKLMLVNINGLKIMVAGLDIDD